MCGGTFATTTQAAPPYGLSPRVRGNPRQDVQLRISQRTIPACAGEPRLFATWQDSLLDYPRVCGGTWTLVFENRLVLGLSPRVRGNLFNDSSASSQVWTIPACAGEPNPIAADSTIEMDYPRVCGGTY